MEEYLPSKWKTNKQKKAGVGILVSDQADFKPAKIKRDKEGHLMIKKINATRRAKYPKYTTQEHPDS